MPKFMLVLRDDPSDFEGVTPEQIQEIIQAYTDWTRKQAEAGRLVAGEKLADGEGKILRGRGGDVEVTDGPFAETKEVLGGYYVIEAADYDEAVEFCRDCPHVGFGGSLEVRRVDEIPGD